MSLRLTLKFSDYLSSLSLSVSLSLSPSPFLVLLSSLLLEDFMLSPTLGRRRSKGHEIAPGEVCHMLAELIGIKRLPRERHDEPATRHDS